LFQYSSEKLDTGVPEVDVFESLKSYDETKNDPDDPQSFGDNSKYDSESDSVLNFDESNPFGEVS